MPKFDEQIFMATGKYHYEWPIHHAQIKEESVHFEWRHLGNYQSNSGSSDELLDQLHRIVNDNLKYMCF